MANREHYTLKEIENAIRNKESMYIFAEGGALDAIDRGIDAEHCLKQSNPTEVQAKCIELVWKKNMSLAQAGSILGVTPQAIQYNIDLLRKKMQKVLDKWKALDEEAFANV
ncbi:hypothetical protein [Rummeliibacillus stabekisii]|uniref:hypothetical protein n=1 Tax=Rummeliibacillus stabekisii TaxID=241244 RepID=UPI0037185CDA